MSARAWLGSFWRCLAADVLKLRRTRALALPLLLPLAPALVVFFYMLQQGPESAGLGPVPTTVEAIVAIWASFLGPILAAAMCSLVAGIEHANRGWKELFATSLPRSVVFLSKFLIAVLLWMASHVALAGSIALTIGGLKATRGDGFPGPLEPGILLGFVSLVCFAGLLLLTVHMALALRWQGFTLNLGIALGGLCCGFALTESIARNFYPWSAPAAVQNLALPLLFGFKGRAGAGHVAAVLGIDGLAAAVTLVACTAWLSSRDVT